MSTKNSLKDKIKKPNATQAFFNSYDTDKTKPDEIDNNVNDNLNNKNVNTSNDKNNNNKNSTNKVDNKTYVNNDNDDVVNDEVNDIIDINDNDDDDYLRNLVSGKKVTKKKAKKVFTSFYMDPDLAAEVDKIASRGEKGDKSKLINAAIRKLLEEYGVIQK
ncbi:ribbon-helix-helix domain-containing protein [Metabacillus idriensis]|uniref:ribbon-helix-helix domain-containing protein n=1 Tax=Metabacillus idriensis TaxID=324768 RepID=UPI001749A82F|nr:ribbon-helix-helix domain-containing protein [Metabacillus idriensis]